MRIIFKPWNADDGWFENLTIYIRQGEGPDYIYRNNEEEDRIELASGVDSKYQPLNGQLRKSAARFSPYNLTAEQFKGTGNDYYYPLGLNKGNFVEFPSQAGAFFQWSVNADYAGATKFRGGAYNPARALPADDATRANYWITTATMGNYKIMWNPNAADPVYTTNYSTIFETCPPGYRRPTDGPTNEIAVNGPYPTLSSTNSDANQIENSEIRVSLFKTPFSGNANENADYTTMYDGSGVIIWGSPGTYPTGSARGELAGTANSFYADGFFDRRPIKAINNGYAVSIDNPKVAFKGALFFNVKTKATLFIPYAGRINNNNGLFVNRNAGYYWTSSVGPEYSGANYIDSNGTNVGISYGAWGFEFEYYGMVPKNNYSDFGQLIRCVKAD